MMVIFLLFSSSLLTVLSTTYKTKQRKEQHSLLPLFIIKCLTSSKLKAFETIPSYELWCLGELPLLSSHSLDDLSITYRL